jgi:hypothetical protein
MIFDNTKYLFSLLRRVYMLLFAIIVALLFFAGFFAKKWVDGTKTIYILGPDQTLVAFKGEETLQRKGHEIKLFTKVFLEKAFAHNKYSFEENLKEAFAWLDPLSQEELYSRLGPGIKDFYSKENAVSTVSLKNLEINQNDYPYEVVAEYFLTVKYLNPETSSYEDTKPVPGKLYFELEPLERSDKNPWGLQIKGLEFLEVSLVDSEK